jgi:hypothetical protein
MEGKIQRVSRSAADWLRLWVAVVTALSAMAFALAGGLSRGAFGTSPPAPGIEVHRTAAGQLTAFVRGDGARYLLLFTRQAGDGPWTVAWPLDVETSGPLVRRGRTTPDLPSGAVEVLGVFSEGPLQRGMAEQALRESGPRPAVPGAWLVRVPLARP